MSDNLKEKYFYCKNFCTKHCKGVEEQQIGDGIYLQCLEIGIMWKKEIDEETDSNDGV